jgi:L-lactate dehydrogenase
MADKKVTIGVLGAGHVGAHVAYALGMMGVADVVKICDPKEAKVISERQDLMDAVYFMPHRVDYQIAKYEDLADCDIIINAVGDITLCATGSRDDEMNYTVRQVAETIPKVMAGGFNGFFINITNPCDVVTHLIAKKSGLPKGRVFGTGTLLDSSRLISAIAQQTGIEHHSFNAFMMGEHGDRQMIPWSLVNFRGKPLAQMEKDPRFQFDKEAVRHQTIRAGWVTYSGKFCTEYGICSAAVTLAKAVLHDERKIFPCSCPLDGEYGEKDIFCGVPALIGKNGVEEVMEYDLPADELAEFKACCDTVRANIERAKALLANQ